MKPGDDNIIIGVSNVDAQMRQKEALERVRADKATYSRLMALTGDYICIYTVDPVTDHYYVYSATKDYEGLGLQKDGNSFFEETKKDSVRAIHPDDLEFFNSLFTKENVLAEIKRSGTFAMKYRLLIDGKPVYVNLKAAVFKEKDGQQLIIGVNNIDEQVKRELELTAKLSQAKAKAAIDALTGVKNRSAYADAEDKLNERIEKGEAVAYAVILFDVKGLGAINEKQGKLAGDKALKEACMLVCETFKHGPVFRVLDNQFAVIAQGRDYDDREMLLNTMSMKRTEDIGLTMYYGISEYKEGDRVSSVFERADSEVRSKTGR